MIRPESQVVPLDAIIEFYVRNAGMPEGTQVVTHDYLLDPVRKQVVLNLTLDVQTPPDKEVSTED